MTTKDIEKIMNMTPYECHILLSQKDYEIDKLRRQVEKLGKKCNRYQKKLTISHFGGEENIPKKIKHHNENKDRTFKGFTGIGYYARIQNGVFVIGYCTYRSGDILYRGEYKGADTPFLNNIKLENLKMYNNIVKYFGYV